MGGCLNGLKAVPWFDQKNLFLRPDLTPSGRRAQRRSRIYRVSGARSASLTAVSTAADWRRKGDAKRNETNGCYIFVK
jgi:hypothetical protein